LSQTSTKVEIILKYLYFTGNHGITDELRWCYISKCGRCTKAIYHQSALHACIALWSAFVIIYSPRGVYIIQALDQILYKKSWGWILANLGAKTCCSEYTPHNVLIRLTFSFALDLERTAKATQCRGCVCLRQYATCLD